MAATVTTTTAAPSVLVLPNGKIRNLKGGIGARKGFSEIPIIDVGGMYSEDVETRRKVAADIKHAATKVGFMYITNHGVPQHLIDQTMAEAARFFEKPDEEKTRLNMYANPDIYGYEGPLCRPANSGPKYDLKENYRIAFDSDYDPVGGVPALVPKEYRKSSLWPNDAEFRGKMLEYYAVMLTLARKLVQVFALALDLDEHYFDDKVTHPIANLGILRYPPQHEPETDRLGNRPHSDIEAFTLLYQQHDLPALQILNDQGEWIWAEPLAGAYVLNIGDFLARMTNDKWLSTVHRVVNNTSGKMRHSCGVFFGFNPEEVVAVLPSCIEPGETPKYTPISAGEYLKRRFTQGADRAKEGSIS